MHSYVVEPQIRSMIGSTLEPHKGAALLTGRVNNHVTTTIIGTCTASDSTTEHELAKL